MFPSALQRKACGGMAALARSRLLPQARCLTGPAVALPCPPLPSGCNLIFPLSPSPSRPTPPAEVHLQIPRPFPFVGSMELMAVPKKKVSPHKKGLRNGPKALKPVPVIVRCMACGRVKLPHFYCCSGKKGNRGESQSSG